MSLTMQLREQAAGSVLPAYSGAKRAWIVALVCLAAILNFYDRNLLSALAEPVRSDLHLNDSQLGALNGVAFALVYSLVAVPIAAVADRFGRGRVLAASLTIWSAMTAFCASAVGFGGLAAGRLGVGLGEAGGCPARRR